MVHAPDDENDRENAERANASFDAMGDAIGKMAPVLSRPSQVTFAWSDLLWRMGLRHERPAKNEFDPDA